MLQISTADLSGDEQVTELPQEKRVFRGKTGKILCKPDLCAMLAGQSQG